MVVLLLLPFHARGDLVSICLNGWQVFTRRQREWRSRSPKGFGGARVAASATHKVIGTRWSDARRSRAAASDAGDRLSHQRGIQIRCCPTQIKRFKLKA